MTKVAVMLANGFEEIEALTVVDVLRRAAIECLMVGFDPEVTGSHGITVKVDEVWSGSLDHLMALSFQEGCREQQNLRDHEGLIQSLKEAHEQGKSLAAICAAPIVLDRAGLLDEKRYTCYDGFEKRNWNRALCERSSGPGWSHFDQSGSCNSTCFFLCPGQPFWWR